jgi:DNA mismatch repair ATPase MutS
MHMIVEVCDDGIKYSYKVAEGTCVESSYGIIAAETAGFPPGVLEEARRTLAKLQGSRLFQQQNAIATGTRLHALYRLVEQLVMFAKSTTMDEETSRGYLRALQAKFLRAGCG